MNAQVILLFQICKKNRSIPKPVKIGPDLCAIGENIGENGENGNEQLGKISSESGKIFHKQLVYIIKVKCLYTQKHILA